MPAKITVCYPDRPAHECILFEPNRYRLGRAPSCELSVHHPTVSREHALMTYQGDIWQLNDQQSYNGTKINGESIEQQYLENDALISLGDIECLFEPLTANQLKAYNDHSQWRKNSANALASTDQQLNQVVFDQLNAVTSLVGTQRGILFFGSSLDELRAITMHGIDHQAFNRSSFEGSVGAIKTAFLQNKPIIAMDTSQSELLAHRESIQLKAIKSLAAIPINANDDRYGILYTDSHQSNKLLTELDLEILQQLTSNIANALQANSIQQSLHKLHDSIANRRLDALFGGFSPDSNRFQPSHPVQ